MGLKEILSKTAEIAVGTINLLPNLAICLREYPYILKKEHRYVSIEEFERAYDKEIKKLGIENITINPELEEDSDTYCQKDGEGEFSVVFWKRFLCLAPICHELFHIKRMHEGKFSGNKYRFMPFNSPYEEWLATSYAIKRVKEERK